MKAENEFVIMDKSHGVYTTSLILAKIFGKEHKNVLQSIESIGTEDEFGRLNFQLSSYLNSQNKEQPMYYVTRDGFSMVAMGFTGDIAKEFKIKFIAAFKSEQLRIIYHDLFIYNHLTIYQHA